MAPCNSYSSGSWSSLPNELLISVTKVLPNAEDFVRFGAVCRSWHSAVTKNNYCKTRHMPWLMMAETSPKSKFRRFYSHSEDKIYRFMMPEARERLCFGCPGGWVATVGKDSEVHLVNPFIKATIALPSIGTFISPMGNFSPEFKRISVIRKICVSISSKSPLNLKNPNFFAVALYDMGWRLAFTSPRTRGWTKILCNWWPYFDATFYKGQFYLVNHYGAVVALDFRRQLVKKIASSPDHYHFDKRYLVESSGELLQVIRTLESSLEKAAPERYRTVRFCVYRLDMSTRKWERMENLGDDSLFLGLNTSISVVASELIGCRPNCIYFADDICHEYSDEIVGRGHDMGVYSLADNSIEKHYTGVSQSTYSPPMWVPPFLW
ncbi:putative F-box protein At3g25750 [Typha latifolia]|uniref:putative F-box protein At3g25750 n=1 Tax=Typha latifolia TaxID=4733 RepID=UPI003C30D3FD